MASAHVGRDGLMAKLEELGIKTTTVEHPEVFTIEQMLPHVGHLDGAICKNLFMRDKKKKGLWLLSARHDVNVSLDDLAKKVGAARGLRLADESVLYEKLGVKQGCVTAFALINDRNHEVQFLIDQALLEDDYDQLHFHPMENSATTAIHPKDLVKFLAATGHTPVKIKFDDPPLPARECGDGEESPVS